MNITNVRITKLENSKTLALASITIDSDFVVSGLAIYNGQNGMWVSMPSRKNKDGEYKDIAFPITKEARQTIQDSVLDKFNAFSDNDSRDIYNDIKAGQDKKEFNETYEVNSGDLPF